MTPQSINEAIKKSLTSMWVRGLDFATSEDFQSLEGDEKDEAYLTYQMNSVARELQVLRNLLRDVIEEVKPERNTWHGGSSYPDGWNSALAEMEAKAKDLGL